MNVQALTDTAKSLVATGKGILAMDESISTCNQRFAALGIPQTEEARHAYRELLVLTPGLASGISGVILHDETMRQQTSEGVPFLKVLINAGIIVGIKVDKGTKDLAGQPDEKITEGLDGLHERLSEYAGMGARFAKWRAVFTIGDGVPSESCVQANASDLARYASLCQEAGLVPIIEPEVLMQGTHSLQQCSAVTEQVLHEVFDQLYTNSVILEAMLLKPNMVIPGQGNAVPSTTNDIADATVICLLQAVPAAVPGIVFLSGGQAPELATARLNAMHTRFMGHLPWALSFSFARAIQQPALAIWHGESTQVSSAQSALRHRVQCNQAACRGEYRTLVEQS